MGLNKKCHVHGNEHPDFLCPERDCQKARKVFMDRIKLLAKFTNPMAKFKKEEWRRVFKQNTSLIRARHHFAGCEDCKTRYGQELKIVNNGIFVLLQAYTKQTLGLSRIYF